MLLNFAIQEGCSYLIKSRNVFTANYTTHFHGADSFTFLWPSCNSCKPALPYLSRAWGSWAECSVSAAQPKALADLSSSSQIILTNWKQNPVKQTNLIPSQPPYCILTRSGARKMTSPFSHWLHWFLQTLSKTLRLKKDANRHWGDVYSSTDSTKQETAYSLVMPSESSLSKQCGNAGVL